jgi:hypothetical protein
MTRLHVLIGLLFLVTGVLLVTGCLGRDYVPNHDIILIKVTPAGNLEWSKIIDTGKDDTASIIVPTSDSGLVIPAHLTNQWSLMRVSKDGSIVWERDYIKSGCLEDALTELRDGDFISASSGYGAVCKIDKDGNLVWNMSSVKFDRLESSSVHSIIETNDGGFLVAGDSLFRLDSEGRLSWKHSYGLYSVIEMKNGQSYLGLSQKNNQLFIIQLDQRGNIIANLSLGMYNGYPLPSMHTTKNGYSILYFNSTKSQFESVLLDEKGNITKIQTLINATALCIPTFDGGFSCAELQNNDDKKSNNPFEGRNTTAIVKKLDADGILVWEQSVIAFCKPVSMSNIQLTSLIQTPDGGYIIFSQRDNFLKC